MGNEVQVQKTANALAAFKVPGGLLAKMTAKGGNIATGGTRRNSLLIEGKQWAAATGSDVKVFTRPVIVEMPDGTYAPDPNGAREPVPTLNVIVIDQSARGHTYYPGAFVTGQGSAPACWSEDGRVPSSSVAEPKAVACGQCPLGQKGSGHNPEYPNSKACADVKRLAVQVCGKSGAPEWSIPPLSLKLAISSIWDQRDELAMADGWYAWDNYTKFLADNIPPGVPARTNAFITQMRFGSGILNVQFKLVGFATEADFDKTTEMADTDEVKSLLTIFSGDAKPKGKPLPADDEQSVSRSHPDSVARRAAEAEIKEAAAKRDAEVSAKVYAEAKAVAEAKAAKRAEALRLLAEADAEGGFDDAPPTPLQSLAEVAKDLHASGVVNKAVMQDIAKAADVEKKRTRRTKAEMEAARAAEAAANAPPIAAPAPAPTQPVAAPDPFPTPSFSAPEIPPSWVLQLPAWEG